MEAVVYNFPRGPMPPQLNEAGMVYSGESERGGHQLEAAMACPRMWALKYPLKTPRVRVVDPNAKVPAWGLGNLVHQWNAQHWARQHHPDGVISPERAVRLRAKEEQTEAAIDQALDISEKYHAFILDKHPSWVPLAEECEVAVDYGEGVGRITLGVDQFFWCRETEQPIIMDWKTAGRIANVQKYPYSTQYLRYRIMLRTFARFLGKPDSWGEVYVGVIPTGKTNFHRRDTHRCPYFVQATDGLEMQTKRHLAFLWTLERQDPYDVVHTGAVYGPTCLGEYRPCPFRASHCFLGGV